MNRIYVERMTRWEWMLYTENPLSASMWWSEPLLIDHISFNGVFLNFSSIWIGLNSWPARGANWAKSLGPNLARPATQQPKHGQRPDTARVWPKHDSGSIHFLCLGFGPVHYLSYLKCLKFRSFCSFSMSNSFIVCCGALVTTFSIKRLVSLSFNKWSCLYDLLRNLSLNLCDFTVNVG